ncbi:uncharacterized protein LOC131658076 [Vicia villosa]|uniref:uncharacterized protein LOC131658076 n=1 Tax=Vicia villosa TaxID=3911 RepID=UPI00273CA811|nr:uncharacterized protein LOC131658076 [Vicia villosa]
MANFKYKLISKILADKLSTIFSSNIISTEQKGFIAGRNIKDGICLTSEAINLLGNKSFSGNVALKIDISKVFDYLNWDFILKTLNAFGFSHKFCSWIHTILNFANISICFKFQWGDTKSLTVISILLKEYAQCSGQICNSTKSIIYAGGMSLKRHCRLADIIGFTKAFPPFICLGVPIFTGKPKAKHFNFLADNIKIKLATWKAKLLSMAGRVMMVKTVIHSMMVHCITIYNWPTSIIKSSDKWMRNFIWSGNVKKKLITNQSWATVLAARVKRANKIIKYSIKSSLWKGFKDVYDKLALHSLLSFISSFSVAELDFEDALVWRNVECGMLSIKHAYNMITKTSWTEKWSHFPWDKDSALGHPMLVWKILHNRVSTDENITLCGLSFPSTCSLCQEAAETATYMFFSCKFAMKFGFGFVGGFNCLTQSTTWQTASRY